MEHIKIPKNFRMFGNTYKIIRGELRDGGSFNLWEKELRVPRKDDGSTLMHELIESILTNQNVRYHPPELGMEYMFVMNHTKMGNLASSLVQIIKDNKLNFNPMKHAKKSRKKNTKKRNRQSVRKSKKAK